MIERADVYYDGTLIDKLYQVRWELYNLQTYVGGSEQPASLWFDVCEIVEHIQSMIDGIHSASDKEDVEIIYRKDEKDETE